MRRSLFFVLGLILVTLAGAFLRSIVAPDESGRGTTSSNSFQRDLQVADKSVTVAQIAFAGAGVVLMLGDGWTMRVAGGLLLLAAGFQFNLAGKFWQLGLLVYLLVGIPLLMFAWARHRFVEPKKTR